jgi:hypothetical protein
MAMAAAAALHINLFAKVKVLRIEELLIAIF